MTDTTKRNEDKISAPRLTNREIAESIATNHSMTWLLEVESIERLLDTRDRERDEAVAEAVRRERKKIRRDLRRVYFDIITTCCDECKNGSNFSCGGCGGTRRPSNASCGEPLDMYLKAITTPQGLQDNSKDHE